MYEYCSQGFLLFLFPKVVCTTRVCTMHRSTAPPHTTHHPTHHGDATATPFSSGQFGGAPLLCGLGQKAGRVREKKVHGLTDTDGPLLKSQVSPKKRFKQEKKKRYANLCRHTYIRTHTHIHHV